MERAHILLIGQDAAGLQALKFRLAHRGLCFTEACQESAIHSAFCARPQVAVLACQSRDFARDIELARFVRSTHPSVPLLVLASVSSEDLAVEAIHLGAREYIRGSNSEDMLISLLESHLPAAQRIPQAPVHGRGMMIGESAIMRELRQYLSKLAATDISVFISGDTGTGKELAAAMIHEGGHRAAKPIVCINCAAIPDSLLESELFGHARGAFTGAHAAREGKLIYANGGTVFLDEIGDMSLSAQARILRAIESRQVEPIGSNRPQAIDIRFIAATNQPIEKLVEEGRFRQDLYFRLNVARIHMPALRERKEDLHLLLHHYLREFSARLGRNLERFSADALEALHAYDWPGNVRELKNLVESLFISCTGPLVAVTDLPEHLRKSRSARPSPLETERSKILGALNECEWNKSKAAGQLQWSRMTLYRKIKQYNIHNSKHDAA
jgi:DNA-binding NtrC family response regulator